jgi:hypothetical protein
METADVFMDYAHPVLQAERALKALHNAMLSHDHRGAIEAGYQAIVEVRMAIAAIREDQVKTSW